MKVLRKLLAGLAGSVVLTVIHESMRRLQKTAPRMDLLGEEALSKGLHKAGMKVPGEQKLFNWTLAGDIIGNALYYNLINVGSRKKPMAKGTLLGLAAGIGGVVLPKYLGLNPAHSGRTPRTKAMTITWYLIGGLTAAAVLKLIDRNE